MTNPAGGMTHWQALAVAADEQHLFLDAEAAVACDRACDAYLEKLVLHQKKAKSLVGVTGWGTFTAGQQLERVYSERAEGGENSMVDVLQSHIDVVKEMQIVFRKFFVATEAVDESSATDIRAHGPRLGG